MLFEQNTESESCKQLFLIELESKNAKPGTYFYPIVPQKFMIVRLAFSKFAPYADVHKLSGWIS